MVKAARERPPALALAVERCCRASGLMHKNGSTELADFAKEYGALTCDAFVQRFPCPFLKVIEIQRGDSERAFQTINVSQLDFGAIATSASPRIFAVRREGGAENSMVTVGRARNMDIVLESPSVSKLHAGTFLTADSMHRELGAYR